MLGVKNGYPVVPWALALTSVPLRSDTLTPLKTLV